MAQGSTDEQIQPVAGILAAFLPGLGHFWMGEKRRAILIFMGVMGMFWGGIAIGGIDVIDRKEDFWWFVGQAGVGPTAFVVDRFRESRLTHNDPPPNADQSWFETHNPGRTKSLGHPNEIGSLWATLAGMLNAICVIDALIHARRNEEEELAVVTTEEPASEGSAA